MQSVLDELAKLNFAPFWDAMPPSWQTDVTALVHGFAVEMDPEQYDAVVKLVERVRNMLRDKKDVLLMSPLVRESVGDGDPDAPHRAFTIILESPLGTLDGLREIDGGRFLRESMPQIIEEALSAWGSDTSRENRLHLLRSMLSQLRVEYITGEGSLRVMRLHGTDAFTRIATGKKAGLHQSSGDFKVTLHEDRWVPRDMLDRWPTWMARARRAVDRLGDEFTDEQRGKFQSGMATADRILRGFEEAESSRDVNMALGRLGAQLMKLGF